MVLLLIIDCVFLPAAIAAGVMDGSGVCCRKLQLLHRAFISAPTAANSSSKQQQQQQQQQQTVAAPSRSVPVSEVPSLSLSLSVSAG